MPRLELNMKGDFMRLKQNIVVNFKNYGKKWKNFVNNKLRMQKLKKKLVYNN